METGIRQGSGGTSQWRTFFMQMRYVKIVVNPFTKLMQFMGLFLSGLTYNTLF